MEEVERVDVLNDGKRKRAGQRQSTVEEKDHSVDTDEPIIEPRGFAANAQNRRIV